MSVLPAHRLQVLDSRVARDGSASAGGRQCPACERRFTTMEQMQLVVVKRSGFVGRFLRDRCGAASARRARAGRSARTSWRGSARSWRTRCVPEGQPEIRADEVGVAILGPLRELDQVAYLRVRERLTANSARWMTSKPRSPCSEWSPSHTASNR